MRYLIDVQSADHVCRRTGFDKVQYGRHVTGGEP
jgi:hypothetical protein